MSKENTGNTHIATAVIISQLEDATEQFPATKKEMIFYLDKEFGIPRTGYWIDVVISELTAVYDIKSRWLTKEERQIRGIKTRARGYWIVL